MVTVQHSHDTQLALEPCRRRGPCRQHANGNGRIQLTRPQFISSRGNEYFCEIDEEYLTDRFNLTGLNTEVQYYQYALDLVTDVFDFDCDDDMREQIEKSARHLYGLVHARYIVTTRGLAKMVHPLRRKWAL
jgi:casein kinase II subunit beta